MDRENIEAIFPLPAIHQPMLFHTLRHDAASGNEAHLQYGFTARVETDADGFADRVERAWQWIVARHAALRTSCHWADLDQPLQVVHKAVEVEFAGFDWRETHADDWSDALADYRTEDRKRGFDLTTAPAMRVALFRVDDTTFRHEWSLHHLVMDGWSAFLVLGDLFDALAALGRGEALPADHPRPYRDYVSWLAKRDETTAESFWTDYLQGFDAPEALSSITFPAPPGAPASSSDHAMVQAALGADDTAALEAFARQERVTVNTLCQTAWGILLGSYAYRDDAVFGMTVSGRPAALPGVESIVGMFTNAVPVRVRMNASEPLGDWLRQAQAAQVAMREFDHVAPSTIHEWSDVPSHVPLFETLYLFQNYPWDGALGDQCPGVDVSAFTWDNTTTFPLTAVGIIEDGLELHLHHDTRRVPDAVARAVVDEWAEVLRSMPAAKTVGDVARPRGAHTILADLPAPPTPSEAYVAPTAGRGDAPRSDVERLVHAMWSETLGVDDLGLDDNFFDAGGTSLKLMQVVTKLEKATGLKINAWEFVFQTLEQVAAVLEPKIEERGGVDPALLDPKKPAKGGLFRSIGRAIKRKQ